MKQRRRRLTDKQKNLVKAAIESPDATLAELGQIAGYKDAAHVSRALASPAVRARMSEMMDRWPDLRKEALLEKLKEGLNAMKRDPADYTTQHKYLELALQLRGELRPQSSNTVQHNQILVHVVESIDRGLRRGLIEIPPDMRD